MGRKCRTCQHPRRDEIDRLLVSGRAYQTIADGFGLAATSLKRHARSHLPAVLGQAREAEVVASADDLLSQVTSLKTRMLALLGQAERAKDVRAAVLACREIRENIELLARLLIERERRRQEEADERQGEAAATNVFTVDLKQITEALTPDEREKVYIQYRALLRRTGSERSAAVAIAGPSSDCIINVRELLEGLSDEDRKKFYDRYRAQLERSRARQEGRD